MFLLVKYKKILLLFIVILCITLGIYFNQLWPKQNSLPFERLEREHINKITAIYSIYPPYELSQNEFDELIELLSNIVIFEKDTTWGKEPYVGVYCEMFYIEYTNGQTIDISGSPPFFFINDVAYKTSYDPCHKVSDFYWDIVNTKIRPLEQ